eukprot:762481-Hanusia_phi.AAC.2
MRRRKLDEEEEWKGGKKTRSGAGEGGCHYHGDRGPVEVPGLQLEASLTQMIENLRVHVARLPPPVTRPSPSPSPFLTSAMAMAITPMCWPCREDASISSTALPILSSSFTSLRFARVIAPRICTTCGARSDESSRVCATSERRRRSAESRTEAA